MAIYMLDDVAPTLPDNGDFWVAPDANVIGKVVLEEATSVWFGATLRGDNEALIVGAGSNIQDHAVLHTDMGYPLAIGRNCTVGHKALLHGCTVGEQCLIGMGAMVMNGARIGACSLIGAGALITENKEIPPRSLVIGSPGKVVRALSDAEVGGLLSSAQSYQANMRRFRRGLMPVPGRL